ncbi:MAG: hypothetical protein JST54_29700 [Deltaproteobacteria bacterium]|nr:hypothetical protein [Deltaproteobacteria bacterium]
MARRLAGLVLVALWGCNSSSLNIDSGSSSGGSTSVSTFGSTGGTHGTSGSGSTSGGSTGATSTTGSSGTTGPPVFAPIDAGLDGLASVVQTSHFDGGTGTGVDATQLQVVLSNQAANCNGLGSPGYPYAALVVRRLDPAGVGPGTYPLLSLAGLLDGGTTADAGAAWVTWTSGASNGQFQYRFGNGGALELDAVDGTHVSGVVTTTIVWIDGGDPLPVDAGLDASCFQ